MRKDNEKTTKNRKSTKVGARASRGIDYRVVREAAGALADWLADLASEDIRGWRDGERRVREVRDYFHAKIVGEPVAAPSDDALTFTALQLARVFANDPHVIAASEAMGRAIQPMLPMLLSVLTRSPGGAAPACAMPAPFIAPMPRGPIGPVGPIGIVRPPGVPMSVPVQTTARAPSARGCIHLHRA
jgi:hypothetical protein